MNKTATSFALNILMLLLPAFSLFGQQAPRVFPELFHSPREMAIYRGPLPVDEQGRPDWYFINQEWVSWEIVPDISPDHFQVGEQEIWVRIVPDSLKMADPGLYLYGIYDAVEVYHNRHLLKRLGQMHESYFNKLYDEVLVVPIPGRRAQEPVYLHLFAEFPDRIGVSQIAYVSESASFDALVRSEMTKMIMGILIFFAGLLMGVFLKRRRHDLNFVLSFAVFNLCVGMYVTASSDIRSFLLNVPLFWHVCATIGFFLFPVGFYAFVEHTVGKGYRGIIGILWRLHLVIWLPMVILDFIDLIHLDRLMTLYQFFLIGEIALAAVGISGTTIMNTANGRIFLIGVTIVGGFGLHDILLDMNLIRSKTDILHWGAFWFIMLLASLVERRFVFLQQELAAYSGDLETKSRALEATNSQMALHRETLEKRVRDRNLDLTRKNRDLTETLDELRETQRQLVLRERMASLGNLVAGVAHEVNTPVGAVNSAADVAGRCIRQIKNAINQAGDLALLREDPNFRKWMDLLQQNVRVMREGGARITRIVKSLRDFSRRDEAEFQKANLQEGIESALTLLQHELKNKVRVNTRFEDIPLVDCHPNELNQVFVNLLMNAVQAMPEGGEIDISTGLADGERVTIIFRDSGRGIPTRDLPKIFDPGFTTKGVGVGTGLGLSISYNIIAKHGGEILAESEVGKGSTFTLLLPVLQSGGQP